MGSFNYNYTHNKRQPSGFWTENDHLYSSDQKKGNFSFDTIHGLKLKEVTYQVPSKEERTALREEFDGGARSDFVKYLGRKHADELAKKLGLSKKQIKTMAVFGGVPKGFNVHHKLALHGGGKNDFSNFILTPLAPHDQWHNDVMDPQLTGIREGDSRKVMIPWTDEMIYDPKNYGFTKNNEKVEPNYDSVVNLTNYSQNYTVEHVNNIRQRQLRAQEEAALEARAASVEGMKATQQAPVQKKPVQKKAEHNDFAAKLKIALSGDKAKG